MRSEADGRTGALSRVRVIEFAGLGPAPFAATMLADHGAEVVRITRPGAASVLPGDPDQDVLARSRTSLAVDLSREAGRAVARALCAKADVVLEGFRPGVMERLGLGPERLLVENARLVFARMTGWGQTGPNASTAGHDINYAALSGALHAIGRRGEKPAIPLNLVADFGGGGLLMAFAIVAALLEAGASGRGQVIDCDMVSGSALLMSMTYSLYAQGHWRDEREANLLDGAAPFYDCYEAADGRHLAVGAIEPQFYGKMRATFGLAGDSALRRQDDPSSWPRQKARLAEVVATRSRDAWMELFEGSDACVAPVLSLAEAPLHPHNRARGAFVELDGVTQPAPAPRFSATPAAAPRPLRRSAEATSEVLLAAGFGRDAIGALAAEGVVA